MGDRFFYGVDVIIFIRQSGQVADAQARLLRAYFLRANILYSNRRQMARRMPVIFCQARFNRQNINSKKIRPNPVDSALWY